jgi:hypothetical protein
MREEIHDLVHDEVATMLKLSELGHATLHIPIIAEQRIE